MKIPRCHGHRSVRRGFLAIILCGLSVLATICAPMVTATSTSTTGRPSSARSIGSPTCNVTPYSAEGVGDAFTTTWYGQEPLWAGLDRAYLGVWYAEIDLKVQWRLPRDETLSVTGRRLDGSAAPLAFEMPSGYGNGFQPSSLRFPTEGCWEVTAQTTSQQLRFVVLVHPPAEAESRPQSSSDTTDWAALRRPYDLPAFGDGPSCVPSAEQRVQRLAGGVLGAGPVYAQGLGTAGVLPLKEPQPNDGSSLVSVRWTVNDGYLGPLLLRGRQVDGPNLLRFGPASASDQDARLEGADALHTADWRVWRWMMRVPAPGCYALQVDGLTFTEVIVFSAVPSALTGESATPQP